jgi:hypothetical protein
MDGKRFSLLCCRLNFWQQTCQLIVSTFLVVMEVEVKRKLVVRVQADASRRVKHPSPIFYIVTMELAIPIST